MSLSKELESFSTASSNYLWRMIYINETAGLWWVSVKTVGSGRCGIVPVGPLHYQNIDVSDVGKEALLSWQ